MNTVKTVVKTVVCVSTISFFSNTPVVAESSRDLDSHEHGASRMNIVIEGKNLFLEFESPWMNLIGFEHQPSTQEQLEKLNNALDTLSDPSGLIDISSAAECLVASVDVNSTINAEISQDKNDGGQEHEKHEEHETSGEQASGTHSEVLANYTFECAQPEQLSAVTVRLFEIYQGIEDIDVQLAGPSGQSRAELDPQSTAVDLTAVR